MTTLIAFDTSTEQMAMALSIRGQVVGRVEAGGARASAALLPALHRLLAESAVALSDVDAIAFGRGPGAFTGLRTSCAVAQGLGFGLGRPVLPIDSLLVVAEDARVQHGTDGDFEIGIAMDARMDEVYAGRYRWAQGRWSALASPMLASLTALQRAWQPAPPCVAGSALTAFGERLGLPREARCFPVEADRATALGRLARAAFDAGDAVDAASALPLYLRDKVALTTDERAAARAAPR